MPVTVSLYPSYRTPSLSTHSEDVGHAGQVVGGHRRIRNDDRTTAARQHLLQRVERLLQEIKDQITVLRAIPQSNPQSPTVSPLPYSTHQ